MSRGPVARTCASDPAALAALRERIVGCERCPRLVAWRRKTAREKVRRFEEWTAAGVWDRAHEALLRALGERGAVNLDRAVLDSASTRAVARLARDRASPAASRAWRPGSEDRRARAR